MVSADASLRVTSFQRQAKILISLKLIINPSETDRLPCLRAMRKQT